MERKPRLGLTCSETQMKVSLQDLSFSQTPKPCMVRRPEESPAVTQRENCTAGMGSVNKHRVQKILLCAYSTRKKKRQKDAKLQVTILHAQLKYFDLHKIQSGSFDL